MNNISAVIREHHRRAIDNLVSEYHHDERFLAVIIGGSVAKGFARDDSDVDFMIVASDGEYERRFAERDLFINRTDLCDYDKGFVDGKIINLAYLEEAANRGNEPTRAAFTGSFAAYSHIPDLDNLLATIPVYPDGGHAERQKAFYSMSFIQHWLMQEAERHGNRYTMTRAASQLSLFAGRLILAHNRLLFPYHKWFARTLEGAQDKPQDFMRHFDALLESPNGRNATALFECVRNHRDWGVSDLDAFTWFMTDVEWAWMSEATPMEDW